MRVLLFGMRCRFTINVLSALVASEHEIAAVVLPGHIPGRGWRWLREPGAFPGLPMGGELTIDSIAGRHRLPLAELHPGGQAAALETIPSLRSDLIVVACFPRKLPMSIVGLVPFGGCNLHPSLLPALRGPDPLFWTLQQGLERSGVTLHLLDQRFDAGAIVARRDVAIPAGIRIDDLETVMGRVAGQLLLESLPQWPELRRDAQPQPEGEATIAPNPVREDFRVSTDWPVERAVRFVRGVASIGEVIEIFGSLGQIWRVRDVLIPGSGSVETGEKQAGEAIIEIPFVDGVLRAFPADKVR